VSPSQSAVMSVRYALLGILLGVGAPAGQLLLRMSTITAVSTDPLADLRTHVSFYGYQLVGTCIVFCLAGIAAGRRADGGRRAAEFYHRLSEHDPLTGLLNARAFGERCARVMERAAGVEEPVSMILIDVDRLKDINDRHGHAAGNDALIHVAVAISETKRSEDEAARWGGDEFAVLLEGGDEDAAVRVAEGIVARLRMTPLARQQPVVTVTIGIATAREAVDTEDLFAAADRALYDGKSRGGDRIEASPPLAS
jgi:diguanylate cyclase (GGDEF)-like protein